MSDFKQYQRTAIAEMRPYIVGEILPSLSISDADIKNGSPKAGDMVARNPKNHDDQWLVAADYFADNFCEVGQSAELIEQQQARIAELERERDKEKFIAERMKDAVCIIETVNDQLAATVERLRLPMIEFIRKCDNGEARSKRSYAEMKEAIAATPQQNLNAVKRDAYKDGFIDGYRLLLESANGIAIHNYCGMAEKYANTKYPSGKE